LSDFKFQRRLFCLFFAGIGAILPGCNEEATAGKSNTATAAFGPTLVIKANAPGFSAENMATLIAAPIEKQLAAFETLPLVESISTEGQVEFLLHTKTGCNLKQVESLIGDRLASLKESLPQAVNDTGLQIQTKTAPLFVVAVYSPEGKHDNVSLSYVVKITLREQLAHVQGVGEVTVLGAGSAGDDVTVKQHSGIALLLAPTVDAKPAEIATALKQRLEELRSELPEGILLTLPINTTDMPDPRETLLLLEMQLPQGTDASQRSMELSGANTRLRDVPGIKSWVGFTRHPLESGNHNLCMVVHAAANEPEQAPKKVREAIQKQFAPSMGMKVRLKSFGKPDATVIRAAVSGPDVMLADDLAGKLVDKLQDSRSYTAEQQRSPLEIKPRFSVKLDRSKLAAHGVTSAEIMAALGKTLGVMPHEDTAREQISIPDSPQPASASSLAQCRVTNAQGNEIALNELATIETVPAKMVVYRVNNQPAVLLTAQTVGEQTQKDAREQIGALFAAARGSVTNGDEYKLTWLEE
jgi:multidrug efflux pump subunit AcrB